MFFHSNARRSDDDDDEEEEEEEEDAPSSSSRSSSSSSSSLFSLARCLAPAALSCLAISSKLVNVSAAAGVVLTRLVPQPR